MAPSLNEVSVLSSDTIQPQPYSSKTLKPGIYIPTVAFFLPNEELDLPTTTRHAIRLALSGARGLVTHGSNGEAVHLTHEERKLITRTTRAALDSISHQDTPLIVGCGAQSTRETVQLCKEAYASGGTHALILPPSYYSPLIPPSNLLSHFKKVADESPIPIVIYNFPSAASGLDLSSDQIITLSKHANIVGVKLTCGNTGKLSRIVDAAPEDFLVMGGSADFLLQALVVGGKGVIAGVANLAPRACRRVMELFEAGEMEDARVLQAIVARGDWVAIQGGFLAVKAGLEGFFGYGGRPRLPCVEVEGERLEGLLKGFEELMMVEKGLGENELLEE